MMILTFNCIHKDKTLSFDNQKYIKNETNPYEFVSVNPVYTINIFGYERCWIYLTEIVIPDSVTTISYSAFQSCTSLTKIVIPDSVTFIGYSAFGNCTSLTMVETNNENAYIIEYCKRYHPSVEVIVNHDSYILK